MNAKKTGGVSTSNMGVTQPKGANKEAEVEAVNNDDSPMDKYMRDLGIKNGQMTKEEEKLVKERRYSP